MTKKEYDFIDGITIIDLDDRGQSFRDKWGVEKWLKHTKKLMKK